MHDARGRAAPEGGVHIGEEEEKSRVSPKKDVTKEERKEEKGRKEEEKRKEEEVKTNIYYIRAISRRGGDL